MHAQQVLRANGARSTICLLAAVLVVVLAGCGDVTAPSITTPAVSQTPSPIRSTAASSAPSPSGSPPAAIPERIVFHRAGAAAEHPPSELARATARTIATG